MGRMCSTDQCGPFYPFLRVGSALRPARQGLALTWFEEGEERQVNGTFVNSSPQRPGKLGYIGNLGH